MEGVLRFQHRCRRRGQSERGEGIRTWGVGKKEDPTGGELRFPQWVVHGLTGIDTSKASLCSVIYQIYHSGRSTLHLITTEKSQLLTPNTGPQLRFHFRQATRTQLLHLFTLQSAQTNAPHSRGSRGPAQARDGLEARPVGPTAGDDACEQRHHCRLQRPPPGPTSASKHEVRSRWLEIRAGEGCFIETT